LEVSIPSIRAASPNDASPAPIQHRWDRRLDGLLAVLVLVLAFLSGSFAVRNGDFWFHLATGRLLAQAQFVFGVDPFAYTTQHVYWTNHAWLFDLLLYVVHGLLGDAGLVVLKALLVTVLAGLLLRLSRADAPGWLPASCTALVVLAMSPRLLLQPACLSYFFLGVSLWLLVKPQVHGTVALGAKHYLLLPLLFALWANADEWFLLGPVLVALFWTGERLQGNRWTPGWVLPASLAACLLNPHTYHAFAPPAELSPVTWSSGLRQDARFHALFASPWQSSTFLQPAVWQNASALAYFALVLLGLVSFCLHREALRGWRFLVWVSFGLFAAWRMRAIPFFAVVSGPITVLNLQDFALSRRTGGVSCRVGLYPAADAAGSPLAGLRSSAAAAGRFVLVLGAMGLIFLAWPGWLQGFGRKDRRVAWTIQPDSSLLQAAQVLHVWRSEGKLRKGERVFTLHPEVAQYTAWFCPGEKHFFDYRYPLFPEAAREFEIVFRALDSDPTRKKEDAERTDWQRILRDHHVGVVILFDPDTSRLLATARRLADDPEHWVMLDVAGRVLFFGWKEARPTDSFAELAFAPDRLAYTPQDEKACALPPAPERGPGRGPRASDFWTPFVESSAPSSWEAEAAMIYIRYFEVQSARQAQMRWLHSQGSHLAGLIGLPASGADPVSVAVPVAFRLLYQPLFLAQAAERDPDLLLLAVRAARRAVAENPDDDKAYLALGLAYLLLRDATIERSTSAFLPPLAVMRHVQIVTALEQALRRNPDLELAHQLLADLYLERRFLDVALEHRLVELRLSRRIGPRPGEEAASFADRLERTEKAVAALEDDVLDRKADFVIRSRSLHGDTVRQARLALEMGLARQAADLLLPVRDELLGSEGVKLELHLLLLLGQAEEIRNSLYSGGLRAAKNKLGVHDVPSPQPDAAIPLYRMPAYEWLLGLQAAASGDYAVAAEMLREIRARLQAASQQLESTRRRVELVRADVRQFLIGELGLTQPHLRLILPPLLERRMEAMALLANDLSVLEREPLLHAQQADSLVVEGMLALEQGSPAAARRAFQDALALCPKRPNQRAEFAGWSSALSYLRRIEKVSSSSPLK
jgi:tetratricopeptide (TPR) repeat protein